MKPRTLGNTIQKAMRTFPSVVVTGPRQSGKTTLLKTLLQRTHTLVSLENPDVRLRAREDPIGFLDRYSPPVIFDEIQYVPELLSYIKTRIDEHRKPGQWICTGSQQFSLMQGVAQSLAGRAAVLTLLPFSYAERVGRGEESRSSAALLDELKMPRPYHNSVPLHECILRGNYPEISSKRSIDRELWCGSYIATYLERDVRNLSQIGDMNQFERFLKLCATRTGQLLNLSDMARDIGISVPTAKRWLSLLETSHQIYLLYPYYRNIGKRIVKSPKLYFNDTALASFLLGIHTRETLLMSPHFGNLFETMIVIDFVKRFLHHGAMPALSYLRTRDGLEIDLVIEEAGALHLFEVKSTSTIVPAHAAGLIKMREALHGRVKTAALISTASHHDALGRGIMHFNWKNILSL